MEDLGILLPATAVDFFTLVTGMAGFLLKTSLLWLKQIKNHQEVLAS